MFCFPIAIEIDITNHCNLQCTYCRNAGFTGTGDIKLDILHSLINECIDNGIFKINISGGEPTIHQNFWEIASILRKLPYGWSLTTNGTTSDERLVKHLSSNGLKSVFITLAGFSSETEKLHKGNNYNQSKVLEAISLYQQYDIPITLGYIITPYNIKEIDTFCEFCLNNHIPAKLMRVENMGNGCDSKLHVSEDEYNIILKDFKQKLGSLCHLGEQNSQIYDIQCKAGVLYCVVAYDTNIYPCVRFLGNESFICGSIAENSLSEIWQNSIVFKKFREPRIFPKKCTKCPMSSICQGGCRAKAYEELGDYKKSQRCTYYV